MNLRSLKYIAVTLLAALSLNVEAGNPDRIGEAGATHLLINPWARSSGWGGAFTAGISGLEAMRFNVAGTVNSPTNEIMFSRTNWLAGADININAFGLKTKLGASSALTATIMSFDMGDFVRTETSNPDGDLGTFSPAYTNIGIGYAYAFSEQTSGGVTVRMSSESIPDMTATGVALDAGIQYRSGEDNRFKLGFSLRNVGPSIRYSGDGVDFRAEAEDELDPTAKTVKMRVAPYELPSILNMGLAYDVLMTATGKFTLAGNFMANSFGRDNIQLGAQYGYKDMLILRGGFAYEEGIFNEDVTTSAMSGPSFGATFQLPYGSDNEKYISIDYSYRGTQSQFAGIQTLGASLRF